MACNDWFEYNGTVLVNAARTVALARTMGIDTVRISASSVDWIETVLRGGHSLVAEHYEDITTAPWYDAQYPASEEFAGILALDMRGLDDSTLESAVTEYITDGGHTGNPRNATLPIVGNVAIIAKTERGAEYGKRWLDRILRATAGVERSFCDGTTLRYSRWRGADAPVAHRRNVGLTRGTSVTSRRKSACAATWLVTFTLTAGDPYEYGEPDQRVTILGAGGGNTDASGPGVLSSGTLTMTEVPCASFDYSPIYDPLYPALIAPPAAPDFLPAGWTIEFGDTFERYWTRVSASEPSSLNTVPVIQLRAVGVPATIGGGFGLGGFGLNGFGEGAFEESGAVRMVRVSIWPSYAEVDTQCDPLFSAVATYLPSDQTMYIDGEQQAAYIWDGFSPVIRRADSLVYSKDAYPVQWAAFNDPDGLLVTLDVFDGNSDKIRASLALVPKSD